MYTKRNFQSAKDVMTKEIVFVDGMATAKEAVEIMRLEKAEALIVKKRHDQDAYGIVIVHDFIKGVIGSYMGNIPCADREGIQYQLKLNENLSYTLKLMYQSRSEEIVEYEGFYSLTYTFLILLDEKAGTMNYLTKADNGLLLLDKNGSEIQGELATAYILNRVN